MLLIYHNRCRIGRMGRELGVPRVYPNRAEYNRIGRRPSSVAVNWGVRSAVLDRIYAAGGVLASHVRGGRAHALALPARVINRHVDVSISKISSFAALQAAGVSIPQYSTDFATLPGNGRYLGRRDGLAHGEGIVIYEAEQQPEQEHDFYVRVVSKAHEVRFHVFDGDVIYAQRKVIERREGGEVPLVRSHANGARFSSQVQVIPNDLLNAGRELAIRAVAALGLDFAAVDTALTRSGNWVVFEPNTAPGIEEFEEPIEGRISSWEAYKGAFERVFAEEGA